MELIRIIINFLKKLFILWRPDYIFEDISKIDFRDLSNNGIDFYIIDVDGTLAVRKKSVLFDSFREKIAEARAKGWIKNICLVSNLCIPSKKRVERIEKIAKILRIDNFYCAYLPWIKPCKKPFEKGLAKMPGAKEENTVVIGDQIFSDIEGGNRMGLCTVLVKPIGKDSIWTLPKRIMEKFIYYLFDIHF